MESNSAAKERITTKEFSAKFRTKTEVYTFVTIDVAAYMPAHECCTIYWLKDIVNGNKKCKCLFPLLKNS